MCKNKQVLVLLIFMAISYASALAQSRSSPPFSTSVQVSVTAEENIKNQIESYVNRELRSLQDVVLVDQDADSELSILAMEISTVGSQKADVDLSFVILSPFSNEMLSPYLQEQYREFGTDLTMGSIDTRITGSRPDRIISCVNCALK